MLHDGVRPKRYPKLAELCATPEAWILAASIIWCAVLAFGLVYVILITVL